MPNGDFIGMNYQGDPMQGLGSNAGIATPDPMPELKHINETIKNIMLLDQERNVKIWQQKVADRDNLTNQILNNQVAVGDIDPNDQKHFDEGKSDVEKAFKDWGGNWNDTEGYRKYQEKVTHLKDVAAHAQTRKVMLDKLKQEKSEATLPWEQKAIQDHIDKQESQPFWNSITPYQKMFSLDYGSLQNDLTGSGMTVKGAGGKPEFQAPSPSTDTKTTTTTAKGTTVKDVSKTVTGGKQPATKGAAATVPITGNAPTDGSLPPVFSVQESYWDADAMKKKAQLIYLQQGPGAENQNKLLEQFEKYSPTNGKDPDYDLKEKKKFIDNINSRLDQYNAQTGGNVEHIKMTKDGQVAETAPDFAWKTVLANINGNYTAKQYSYDENAIKLRKQAEDVALKNRGLNIRQMDANTKRMAVNLKARAVKNMDADALAAHQVWDKVAANIKPTFGTDSLTGTITDFGTGAAGAGFNVEAKDLPEGFTYVAGVNAKGQPIQLIGKDAEPIYKVNKTTGKPTSEIVGYKPGTGHFDANYYIPSGVGGFKKDTRMSPQKLYEAYQRTGGKADFKDFLDEMVSSGKLDYELEGQNGRANRVSSYVSQQAINNKDTKKGQSGLYDLGEYELNDAQASENDDNE